MGAGASVNDIVQRLEGLYGTVESGAVLLQQLYDSKQGAEESISSYSARLQLAINKAEQRGGSGGSRGGGGGLGGLNPPPPPLGLPSKNLMCIEKRHHNMSRPTQYVPIALCLRLSLRQ